MFTEIKRLFKKKPTTLLELFKYIKSTGVSYNESRYGICNLVNFEYDIKDKEYLKGLFKKWPNFSGCIGYPIPPYIGYKKPDDSIINPFMNIYFNKSSNIKWSKYTDYGKARWNFIEWAIKELEERNE